jgi:truncated hemoglobin YjbI
MLGKPSSQSQSISGTQVIGSQVQQGQAEHLAQSQMGNLSTEQHGLSGAEVVKLLEELETAVKAAGLPTESEEEVLECLKPAKRAAGKENANKDYVAQSLKQASEVLETASKATDASKNLWQKGQEIFKLIAPWLGTAAKLLGF